MRVWVCILLWFPLTFKLFIIFVGNLLVKPFWSVTHHCLLHWKMVFRLLVTVKAHSLENELLPIFHTWWYLLCVTASHFNHITKIEISSTCQQPFCCFAASIVYKQRLSSCVFTKCSYMYSMLCAFLDENVYPITDHNTGIPKNTAYVRVET